MAENIGQEFTSPLMEQLLRDRTQAVISLGNLNNELAHTHKMFEKRSLKQSIRNVEQQIKQIDKSIDKERNDIIRAQKAHNQEILANQGIDSRANMLQGVSGIVQSSSALAGQLMGVGGLSAIGVQKQVRKGTEATAESNVEIAKGQQATSMKQSTMYIIAAVVIVALLLFSKKR